MFCVWKYVLNFCVNIFLWEPHENILTWKFVKLEIIVHLDIIYYSSLSCATAKCSPALNKTARYSVLEHIAIGNKHMCENGI